MRYVRACVCQCYVCECLCLCHVECGVQCREMNSRYSIYVCSTTIIIIIIVASSVAVCVCVPSFTIFNKSVVLEKLIKVVYSLQFIFTHAHAQANKYHLKIHPFQSVLYLFRLLIFRFTSFIIFMLFLLL